MIFAAWALLGCAPVGWLDGAPVRDLERAIARAPAGAVLRIAAGEHELSLEIPRAMTLEGAGEVSLRARDGERLMHAAGPLTLRNLTLEGGFASEGASLWAEGPVDLGAVRVLGARGRSAVRLDGGGALREVEVDTPWPAVRLRASGAALLLEDSAFGPGVEPAVITDCEEVDVQDVLLDDSGWGSALRGARVRASAVTGAHLGVTVTEEAELTDLHLTGTLAALGPSLQLSVVRADLVYAESAGGASLSEVRARALGLVGGEAERVLLTGAGPALSLVRASLRGGVIAARAEPSRIALSDARVDGLLVIDPGAAPEAPAFHVAGSSWVRQLTWRGGSRGVFVAGQAELRLERAIVGELEVGVWDPDSALDAREVGSWSVSPPPPWALIAGGFLGPDDPRHDAVDLPWGAFAGPEGAAVAALWAEASP